MSEKQQWWQQAPELETYYHNEWGIPQHDDRALFELLSLEMLQAGLSWLTVLKKRTAFQAAFHNFEIDQVAKMKPEDIERLMQDPSLIRNRQKLEAIVNNAKAVLNLQKKYGSFDHYLWQFVANKPIVNRPRTFEEIPSQSDLSKKIAKDLKQHGFKFVGPTIIYSYLEGSGIVDDHLISES